MTARLDDWEVGVVWLHRRLRRPDQMMAARWRAATRRDRDEPLRDEAGVGTAVAAGRVLFGQPWEVIARRDGETCAWRVFGHRGARALVTEVETAIALGADPTTVRPDALDRHTLDSTAETLRLYRRNGFRWLGNVFGLLLGAAGIALVFVVGVLAA